VGDRKIESGKIFREKLGFKSKAKLKNYFKSKDIIRDLDKEYLANLNIRLEQIVRKLDEIVDHSVKADDLEEFISTNLHTKFDSMLSSGQITKLTNQGRTVEDVYFSWMRGYMLAAFFKKPISMIFGIHADSISSIGGDYSEDEKDFKRLSTADFEFTKDKEVIRIEFQSGFTGVNQIKRSKVEQAISQTKNKISTYAFHVDLFSGVAALIRLDTLDSETIQWIKNARFEGAEVFDIPQKYFVWDLGDTLPNNVLDFS